MDQWQEILRHSGRQAVISMSGHADVEDITSDFSVMAMGTLSIAKYGGEVVYHFRSSLDSNRYSVRLLAIGAIRTGEMFQVSRKLNGPFLNLISGLSKIQSLIIQKIFVRKGCTYITFWYHFTQQDLVSEVLMSITNDDFRLLLEYMGEFRSMEFPLSYSAGNMPHQSISISLNPPDEARKEDLDQENPEWFREIRFRRSDGMLDCVYSSSSPLRLEGFTRIWHGDLIYHGISRNVFINELLKISVNGIHFPGRIVQYYGKGKMILESVFPSPMNNSILSIVRKASDKFPQWKPTLLEIQNIK